MREAEGREDAIRGLGGWKGTKEEVKGRESTMDDTEGENDSLGEV